MLIAVDHGNKQIKTVHTPPFTSGLIQSDTPGFGTDALAYRGKYYTLTDQRIPYRRDKTEDERFFILTLFAIAHEIEAMGQYSGSLMRYYFDEAEQHKGVIVGTIGEDGSVETDFRELSPLHQVRVLEGTFDELMSEKREASEDYLQVILTDELPVIDAMPKLREKYKNALGVEQNMGYKEDSGRRDIELEHMSDQDIFRVFVSEFRARELSDKEEALANVCWEAVYKKEEER